MRILITGAQGLIGKKLVSKLKETNHTITILSRKGMVRGDLLSTPSLEKATENIDLVIHLAGITHTNNEQLYYDVNTKGTKNLIEASIKNSVKRFIYISTRAASSEGGAYAYSKLLAEKEVIKSSLDWIILRPAEVYGAGEKEAISRLIKIIQKSFFVPVLGNGKYTLAPVYVEDVISAIVACLNKNISKKIYTIAGPEEITYNALIDKISNYINVKRIKIHVPVLFFRIASLIFLLSNKTIFVRDQIPRLICKKSSDIHETSRDLHFFPITFKAGLEILLGRKGSNAQ